MSRERKRDMKLQFSYGFFPVRCRMDYNITLPVCCKSREQKLIFSKNSAYSMEHSKKIDFRRIEKFEINFRGHNSVDLI